MKKFKTFCDCDFKENCKTTIFKNISKTFKTTVINDGFSHFKKKLKKKLKKKIYVDAYVDR